MKADPGYCVCLDFPLTLYPHSEMTLLGEEEQQERPAMPRASKQSHARQEKTRFIVCGEGNSALSACAVSVSDTTRGKG